MDHSNMTEAELIYKLRRCKESMKLFRERLVVVNRRLNAKEALAEEIKAELQKRAKAKK